MQRAAAYSEGIPAAHDANISVSLVRPEDRKRDVFEIVNQLRPKLLVLPGGKIYASTGGFLKFLLNFGSAAPIDVSILGYDFDAAVKSFEGCL